jgi:hypothetical protein
MDTKAEKGYIARVKKQTIEKKINPPVKTTHNKRYTLRRLIGGSGSEKPQSGFALCSVFSPPHFGQGSMLRIAL